MNLEEPIIGIEYAGSATVVTLLPQELLDGSLIVRLRETLYPLADEAGVNLIMDFSQVKSLSSSALGYLMEVKKQVEQRQGRFIICGVKSKVINTPDDRYINEIFKVARLDTFFEICEGIPESLRRLESPCPVSGGF